MIRRESSSDFLRQKQKQWEREKAESEKSSEWFPFGDNLTPGGGSPLRKHEAKIAEEPSTSTTSPMASLPQHKLAENLNSHERLMNESMQQHAPPSTPSAPHHHPHAYPYPLIPAYTFPYHQFYQPGGHGNGGGSVNVPETPVTPQYFAPQYQVIPAGAIPVSTINIDPSQLGPVDQMSMWTMPPPTGPNGMRYGIPIPAPFVPQIMTTSTSSNATQVLNAMLMTSSTHTTHNDSSSESGVSGVKDDDEKKPQKKTSTTSEDDQQREERQSTSDYTDDDPIPMMRRSTTTNSSGRWSYEEQIAERRRVEQEEENRERAEMLEAQRQRKILEDRRQAEEERRKLIEHERLEEDRRRADQFASAMEKARKEAELLKKAKLYKHVLRAAEEEGGDEQFGELEQKILGVDAVTGRRLLKEVTEVERHKQQDEQEMRKKAPQPEKDKERSFRARSSSISSAPSSPFSRNSAARRSVRTTSREKQQVTVVEPERKIAEQMAGPPRPQPSAHHLPPPLPAPRHHPPENRRPESDRPPSTLPTLAAAQPPPPRNTDKMLKTGGFYCPINREPLSYREEARIGMQKPTTTTTPGGSVGRHNEITQSALFGPIATRNSVRRGQMRGIGMQSPTTVRLATKPQRTSSFEESSSGGEDAGSISPDLSHKNFESPLPSSTENVHPAAQNSPPLAKNDKNLENGSFEFKTPIRTRSALGSPMSMLNGGDAPPSRCASPSMSRLMQRLEQKGTIRRDEESSSLSQDVRRLAETNLSRSPSMASLRGSIQNLSLRGSHLNLSTAEPSPNLSKFASVNSPARQSLTSLKKTTDRQTAVLERLGRLRESLHAGKNYTPPRGNFASTSRLNTPAGTPPISPRPVL